MRCPVSKEKPLGTKQILDVVWPGGGHLPAHLKGEEVFAGLARGVHEDGLLKQERELEHLAESVRKGRDGGWD